MSKEKLAAAKQFIEEKHYHEARVILEATHHPKATEWLARLPKSAKSEKVKNSPTSNHAPARAFAMVAVLFFTFVGGVLVGSTTSQHDARNTQIDITRTAIRSSNMTTEALIYATQTAAQTQENNPCTCVKQSINQSNITLSATFTRTLDPAFPTWTPTPES